MKSPDQLVAFVARGHGVVIEHKGENRTIRVLNGRGGERAAATLTIDAYEAFMTEAMSRLAAGHPRHFTVDIKRDFYGGTWVEVRSGLFGRNVARLRISPRHISVLQGQLEANAHVVAAS
ncbi:MAG: hypothetical protein JNM89_03770 [Hyphomicrobiaceae bacterium]|nr:hypothetical protein [Hyphomicrobiaceae bacterium]